MPEFCLLASWRRSHPEPCWTKFDHEALFGSSSAVQRWDETDSPRTRASQTCLTCSDEGLVPLAGLEPAACCLGDVSAQTLCSTTKLLVSSERKLKVIVSSELRYLLRYLARSPSAAIGHVHHTVSVRSQRAPHRAWPVGHRGGPPPTVDSTKDIGVFLVMRPAARDLPDLGS
jgi:hypothetical protein